MATSPAQLFVQENHFYGRLSLTLAAFILFAFGLFNSMGVTDWARMPASTYVHGFVMIAWLALFVVQSILGAGRNLPLHRKLGWFGAGLAALVVMTGWNTGWTAHTLGRVPPIFDRGYFLALTWVGATLFGVFVLAAILKRKRTDWHRRLMLGALIMILEPAIGRLTIIGYMIAMGGPERVIPYFAARPWGIPLTEMAAQLVIVGAVMARDRSIRGSVHPALWWIAAAVIGSYALLAGLAMFPPFADFAAATAGGAS